MLRFKFLASAAVTSALALSLFAVGCDKSSAPKVEATAAKEVTAPKGAIESLTISADSSKVAFVGAKVTGKHDGSFGKFTGKVDLADGKIEGSLVSVEIDTASVSADDEKLTGHLKSPDFFDVAKYPTAAFVSTQIKAGGAEGATHTITGNLTLHGVQKSISFPAKIELTDDAVTASADFAINRKDFGVVYKGMPDNLIKDDVIIKLSIKASRKKS
jgi:polyisoprenoid-binding protein YceI